MRIGAKLHLRDPSQHRPLDNAGKIELDGAVGAAGLGMPIDFFFRQLAGDQRERAIGIVLSGMGPRQPGP